MAFRSQRRRIFRKYVVIVVGLVTGAVVASGAVEAYFAFRDNEASLVQIQREKASAAASAIEQFIGEVERDIGTSLHPGEVDEASIRRRYADFIRILHQVPSLTELDYIDSTGTERIRHSLDAPDVPRGDRSRDPAFLEPKVDQPYFSPVFFVNESEPHMTMALRAGPSGGVVVADLTLKLIRDVISGIKVGKAGLAYAVDSQGNLIIHPDPTLLLKRTNLASLPQVRAALGAAGGTRPKE